MGVWGKPAAWDRFYATARWARIRKHQLLEHPLCAFCAERGEPDGLPYLPGHRP